MIVLIQLNTAGADTGPTFNLYTDLDYVTPFDTNVAKADLIAGYNATVPDGANSIRIQSVGVCDNYIDVAINTTTSTSTSTTSTSTSTTTTTTTVAPTTTTTTTTVTPIAINVTNSSTDIILTAIDINGNAVTVLTGSLPLSTGGSLTATMADGLIGAAVPVTIQYTNTTGTQSITLDSGSPACYNVEAGTPATYTRDIVLSDTITIAAVAGACV